MDLIGQKIGPYEILEKIGQGGMGIVFKARHEKLGRLVALKMLVPHLANNQEMRARFLREAKLQANLVHPNVVNIFDYIEEGDNVFLVMEFVSGQTLEQMLLQKGQFTVQETLNVAEGVLEALAFMHRKGIIHRDIKPSNIMVTDSGLIKVTDFGIARLVEGDAAITRAGAKVGTLYYMAPELLKSGTVSPLVDIYSLGVTLYQLLTGKVPFAGRTEYEIIKGHIEKKPTPIKELNPNVPDDLVKAVEKALEKDPRKRFQSAAEFLQEIKKIKSSLENLQASKKHKKSIKISSKISPKIATGKFSSKLPYIVIVVGIIILLAAFIWFQRSKPKQKIVIPAANSVPSTISTSVAIVPQVQQIPTTHSTTQKVKKLKSAPKVTTRPTKTAKTKSSRTTRSAKSINNRQRRSSTKAREVTGWQIKK